MFRQSWFWTWSNTIRNIYKQWIQDFNIWESSVKLYFSINCKPFSCVRLMKIDFLLEFQNCYVCSDKLFLLKVHEVSCDISLNVCKTKGSTFEFCKWFLIIFTTTPSFLSSPSPLDWQTVQYPFLRSHLPTIVVFHNPPLKSDSSVNL